MDRKSVSSANKAWLIIGGFVFVHNIIQAGRGRELLSEAVDRWIIAHPWLTRLIIALVATHLMNLIPKVADPFYHFDKTPRLVGRTYYARRVSRPTTGSGDDFARQSEVVVASGF